MSEDSSTSQNISENSDHIFLNQQKESDDQQKNEFHFRIRLYKMLLRYPKAILGILPSLVAGTIPIITFYFVGRVINTISEYETSYGQQRNFDDVKKDALYLVIVAIVTGICKFLGVFLWTKVGSEFTNGLKSDVFEKIMKSDITFFDQTPNGKMLTLLGQESESVQNAFGQTKGQQFQYIGQFLVGIIFTYYYCWKIGLIATCSIPYFIFIVYILSKSVDQHLSLMFLHTSNSITIAEETLSSMRTVRGFNREESEYHRFMEETNKAVKEDQKTGFYISLMYVLIDIGIWSIIVGNLYYGGLLVDQGEFQVSNLVSLFGFILFSLNGIIVLQMLLQGEEHAIHSGKNLLNILDKETSIPFDEGEIIEDFKGHIEFKNVSFKYPTRDVYVLKDVSFEIKPGEIGALVGHSGSGKSTCIQLLERFYDVNEGVILLDGKDIKSLNPHWLHQNISLVSQEPILFQLSIKDNIKYGKRNATDEMVIKAAKKSNALGFIENLDNQFEYFVGEKGDAVSGGQRQRIAIARALIRNPVILLTDEATSALDAESEKEVQIALEKVMKGRTSVVVAHRLSTIKNANVIYVFDSGKIKEKGTHSYLIQKKVSIINLLKDK